MPIAECGALDGLETARRGAVRRPPVHADAAQDTAGK